MVFSMYNPYIPDWAREYMKMTCSYCGALIIDNSDESPDGRITARKCANPKCPGHMQYRVEKLAKYFEIPGIGPKTALTIVLERKLENHLQIIPIWFPNKKPVARLGTIADLCCIEGYGETTATANLNSYSSFANYFNTCRDVDKTLWTNREKLFEAETYFTVAEPLSKSKINVMMTGSFNGYDNRNDFLKEVNNAFGQFVQVVDVGKRKTNVSYLIKEVGAADRSKTALAVDCGIPIVTPAEFVDILCGMLHT